ncbi:MAG: IS1 family transposase [Elusimicrobia bacterium]|nr:IS1 family transposase [Elusimicrobiota bacterium]
MLCPRCGSRNNVKNGKTTTGRQRYSCKMCNKRFSRSTPRGASYKKKKQALHLYLEGNGIRGIARFLKVSHVSVYHWIRKAGETAYKLHLAGYREGPVKVVEMDELRSYVIQKKTISGYGLLTIERGGGQSPLKLAVVDTGQEKDSGTE